MTPFGQKLRELRAARAMTLKQMAAALHVTPAYLSALENGRRGKPRKGLVMQVCAVLGIIWDDAEDLVRLARLSDPRPKIDTAGLSPKATELANRLAGEISRLTEAELSAMLATLQQGEPTGGGKKR
ncbi:MAG: helix-turn-helix domain-containing protein [Alphaproteobacteria bacterium]